MPPTAPAPFSPSELSYLHTSLSLDPPIRPDARLPTSFRPLTAETDLVPSANGSARLCFADGTEAIVGVKAEAEQTGSRGHGVRVMGEGGAMESEKEREEKKKKKGGREGAGGGEEGSGQDGWIEVSIDMPGLARDDDAGVVFLAQMIREGLLGEGGLRDRLRINRKWHWRLYIDILLLSPPNTYPLPLLSLTTHLALLHTRLPALISSSSSPTTSTATAHDGDQQQGHDEDEDEDPRFNDDWAAAIPLYPPGPTARPPITLLVISVAGNTFFDPTRSELAVADAVVAVTVGDACSSSDGPAAEAEGPRLRVLAVRAIDPPGRMSAARGGAAAAAAAVDDDAKGEGEDPGVWKPRRGGVGRGLLARMVRLCVQPGGVGEEVLGGLGGLGV